MNTTEVRTVFAASLKRWRYQRGLSQEDLAERANLHRTYISDVERGARNLSLESINKLAQALEISLPILFSDPSPSDPVKGAGVERLTASPSELVDILLVEDNPGDVELTLLAFKRARFVNVVRVARDGAEALELFFGSGGLADQVSISRQQLILLDLNLPKVNGLEVLRRFKADSRTRSIPIAILTISDKDRDIAECRRLGAEAFMTKPVNLQGLSQITPGLSLTWALIKSTPVVKRC